MAVTIRKCCLLHDCENRTQQLTIPPPVTKRPTSCIDCPSGFYQGAEDSASCLACTPGQYQLGVGSTNCKVCDVGTFGNVSELLDCHLCPPGTHQDVSGQASCLPCIRKCCLLNDCKNRTQQLTTPPPVQQHTFVDIFWFTSYSWTFQRSIRPNNLPGMFRKHFFRSNQSNHM